MDLTTIDPAPPRRAWARLRGRQVAALLTVVLAALLALWGTPTRASQAAFGAALRGGEVSSWELADQTGRYGLEMPIGFSVTLSESSSGPDVIWTDQHGRLYRTNLGGLASLPDPHAAPGDSAPGPLDGTGAGDVSTVDLDQTITATSLAAPTTPTYGLGPARLLGWPLVLVSLAAVVVLLCSSQPRRRTRWGTFWMLGIPMGVGLMWWVLTDSPWSATTDAFPPPAPRQRGPVPGVAGRRGGGTMFLIALALSLLVGVGLLVVRAVPGLGDRPDPAPGSVSWHVVWTSGSTGSLEE